MSFTPRSSQAARRPAHSLAGWPSTCARLLALVLVGLCVIRGPVGVAWAADAEQDVAGSNADVKAALVAATAGDLTTAKQRYDRYENTWFDIEDGVRAKSRDSYRTIEKFMVDVSAAFSSTPVDSAKVVSALTSLDNEQQLFIQGKPASTASGSATSPSTTTTASAPGGKVTMDSVVNLLTDAQSALEKGDYTTASAKLQQFSNDWLDVEGEVKTRSADDYRQSENDMGLAVSLASQKSPETLTLVTKMAARLEPYRHASTYGVFDAAIILLREGLEALLIVVALLAFIKRSGNPGGQTWIWGGAFVGLIASILLGLAIQAFFSSIINPSNRELIEGVVGLVASVMLVYVSYWLHSKASANGWQRYLSQRTTEVVQGGKLVGLGVLAFLAIFREGAETALFYLGMVGNISISDLLLGLAIGFGGLALLGALMTVAGLRIPMRPFFAVASLLVFYLCIKFVGTGIHGLQIAGIVSTSEASFLPSIDALGMYSTWATTIAQLLLLLAGLTVVIRDRIGSHETTPHATASGAA